VFAFRISSAKNEKLQQVTFIINIKNKKDIQYRHTTIHYFLYSAIGLN